MIDGYQIYHDYQFTIYINIKPPCCTSETNIMLYVNYTSIKKNQFAAEVSQEDAGNEAVP